MSMRVVARGLAIAAVVASLAGCIRSDLMRRADVGVQPPEPDRSVIVFMRPSSYGGGIQASVFEVLPDRDELVGVVSYGTKVAYATAPGEHLFMVVGENADFMKADLDAGKTYYALVEPRMGIWKARFSLKPIRRGDDAKLAAWDRETTLVENTDASQRWYAQHRDDIGRKRAGYMEKWDRKSADALAALTLTRDDGR